MRTLLFAMSLLLSLTLQAEQAANLEEDIVPYNPTYSDQTQAPAEQTQIPTAEEQKINDQIIQLKINHEFWYIVMLCLLCVATLTIVLFFLQKREHSAKDIVNATGLTLIIFSTIILVLVVNTSEQLTAAIGILGAIAGYLFRSVQDAGTNEAGNTDKPG